MPSPDAPVHFHCDNCGAQLAVDGSAKTVTCAYCKTAVLLPEALWLRFHPPPAPVSPIQIASDASRRALVLGLVVTGVAVIPAIVGVIVAVTARSRVPASIAIPSIPSLPDLRAATPLDPLAAAGDACNGRRAACARDGKAELACGATRTFRVAQTCKGPNGCRPDDDGTSIRCDTTLADIGDPCTVTDDGCSTDRKAELHCEGGRYALAATCKGPDGCTLTAAKNGDGYMLSCDDHIADVGDPCFDTERTACSSDKKTLLTCTAQHFTVARTCRRGCTVKKLVGTSNKSLDCE